MTPKNIVQLAAELIGKNFWPIEGTEILGFCVTTEVPIWAITTFKAENVEQVPKDVAVCSNEKPGLFRVRRGTPVIAAEEAISVSMEM